ncbi:hypothetical protein B0H19DRAFT_1093586 [Mycena capillaripes]|nr:hypothetical protein B0H19DRAFT_1093586 [Mycena capillaripes]
MPLVRTRPKVMRSRGYDMVSVWTIHRTYIASPKRSHALISEDYVTKSRHREKG